MTSFCGLFQVERGLTSVYLSSNASNLETAGLMHNARVATHKALDVVTTGFPVNVVSNVTLHSVNDLRFYIQQYRDRVQTEWIDITFRYNIEFYTNITISLLNKVNSIVHVTVCSA